MTADTLRRAATLMRERAEAATTHTPWQLLGLDDEHASPWTVASTHPVGERTYVCQDARHAGPHIASWHPAVALAVADWLDEQATTWDYNERAWTAGAADPRNSWAERGLTVESNLAHFHRHALAVARAYLREGA